MGDAGNTEGQLLGLSPGDLVGGRYEIVRVLGVGGTGAVFEARHRAIGRTVAIKLLLPELAANPAVPARFLQEARTANQVRHKNIVEVMDFGDDQGRLYLVMEYLHGESLAAFIKREAPVAPSRIIKLMDPILSALSAAHAQGIVHRDLKPQNIFLVDAGDGDVIPKVIDFGIAKRLVTDDVKLTATGMILGTPAYMAPEQAQGERNVTGATDQYALGAILYKALSGRVPHTADTYPAMLIALVTQDPVDLATLRPDLPPVLARAVMRMLARAPTDRFPTLDAVRAVLAPFRDAPDASGVWVPSPTPSLDDSRTRPDGTPASASPTPPRPVGSVGTTAAPAGPAGITAAPGPSPSVVPPEPDAHAPSGGTPWPILAAVGFVIVALCTAVVMALGHGHPQPPAPAPGSTVADSVTFRVDVEPPGAEIALDGTVVGHGHAEVLRPRDGRRYQLRLSSPGRADVSDVLVASSDARVSRVLIELNPSGPPTGIPGGPTGAGLPVPGRDPRPVVRPPQTLPVPSGPPSPPRPDGRHPHIDRNNPFSP